MRRRCSNSIALLTHCRFPIDGGGLKCAATCSQIDKLKSSINNIRIKGSLSFTLQKGENLKRRRFGCKPALSVPLFGRAFCFLVFVTADSLSRVQRAGCHVFPFLWKSFLENDNQLVEERINKSSLRMSDRKIDNKTSGCVNVAPGELPWRFAMFLSLIFLSEKRRIQ